MGGSLELPIQRIDDRLAGYLVYFAIGCAALTFLVTRDARSTVSVVIVAGACGIAAGRPLGILGGIGRAADRDHRRARVPHRAHRRRAGDPGDHAPDCIFVRADSMDGVRVDLLVAKTPFKVQAVSGGVEATVFCVSLSVIRPEDLIVYELVAFRPRDRLDIEDVINVRRRIHPIDVTHIDRWAEEWGGG